MKFFLAFLLWIFGGSVADNPSDFMQPERQAGEAVVVQVNTQPKKESTERIHYTGKRTIIVLDDTQFRPKDN
ncbi:MAG: hypothetical protein AAFQ87_07820 [Bacteroidota bacterium]